MDIFLSARHIVKQYAEHTALNDVSMDVPRGSIFGLLGPNGAGKTTLIRIINRITAPDSGEVLFNGHPLSLGDVPDIGYLPEERGLYKKMKVGDQAIYLARLKGLGREEAKRRLTSWFERFDIMPWWDKKLEELSKGMQQKVQFVITVLHEPSLLIFDEPFSGFDPVNAELLKQEIIRLKDEGHTVIFSTHNMSSVEEVCDEIALVNHAQVVLHGNVADIKQRYRTGIYELVATGETLTSSPGEYYVLSAARAGGAVRYRICKDDRLTNSGLVGLLAARVEVKAFSEQVPSMHDIFLRTVGEDNLSQNAENHE